MEPENPGADAGVIGTSPPSSVAPDSTAFRDYLTVTLGNTAGWLCADIGHSGYFAPRPDGGTTYKHREWIPRVYVWPADADRAVLELSREAHLADVFLTPYVLTNAKRTIGESAARPLVHADVDGGLDLAKVAALGGYAVASGSGEGHGHVYVPLTESVPLHWHRALAIGLRDALGGDDKIADNDLLRPVGALNHKPAAAGGDPAAVTWLLPPTGERVDPHTLAHNLGVALVESSPPSNGAAVGPAVDAASVIGAAQAVDVGAYPGVLAAIGRVTGDRSEDTARVIGACIDAGLTLIQARSVVAMRVDLTQRLAERRDDDLAAVWLKLIDDRQSRRWLGAGIGPHGAGVPAAPPIAPGFTTTWEPVDLGPYLRGEVKRAEPTLGAARTDGQRLLYAGKEHAVLGETEAGKSWLALACAVAELLARHHVVYVHFEESDPADTVERLLLLGVPAELISEYFHFVGPGLPVQPGWLDPLLALAPTLVVHDGTNEGMALHGHDIMSAEGAALFRRLVVKPCTAVGAATLACDHLAKVRDGSSRDAYGSVHKGNALTGARFVLENLTPFGRGLRGASALFVTKDRPGYLRARGRPTKTAGKTSLGVFVGDGSDPFTPFDLALYPPKGDDDTTAATTADGDLADALLDVIAKQTDGTVESARKLYAAMRAAGHTYREGAVRTAVDDLVAAGRVVEVKGRRGATGYRAVATAARGENDE